MHTYVLSGRQATFVDGGRDGSHGWQAAATRGTVEAGCWAVKDPIHPPSRVGGRHAIRIAAAKHSASLRDTFLAS